MPTDTSSGWLAQQFGALLDDFDLDERRHRTGAAGRGADCEGRRYEHFATRAGRLTRSG